jgi:hypothetical protein
VYQLIHSHELRVEYQAGADVDHADAAQAWTMRARQPLSGRPLPSYFVHSRVTLAVAPEHAHFPGGMVNSKPTFRGKVQKTCVTPELVRVATLQEVSRPRPPTMHTDVTDLINS